MGYAQGEKDGSKTIQVELNQEQTKLFLESKQKATEELLLYGSTNLSEFKRKWMELMQKKQPENGIIFIDKQID